jgi:hypothetical protein
MLTIFDLNPYDLVNLDIAAKDLNYAKVSSSYQKAVNDFDAFLQLIPKA